MSLNKPAISPIFSEPPRSTSGIIPYPGHSGVTDPANALSDCWVRVKNALLDTKRNLSESSVKVHDSTYRAWCEFTKGMGADPSMMTMQNIWHFLHQPAEDSLREYRYAWATRRDRRSHMLELMSLFIAGLEFRDMPGDQDAARVLKWNRELLVRWKAGKPSKDEQQRSHDKKRWLSADEMLALSKVWSDNGSLSAVYSRALVLMAMASFARRAELVKIRWRDINWSDRTITIVAGKGATAPADVKIPADLHDTLRAALDALRDLQAREGGFVHVFPRLIANRHSQGFSKERAADGADYPVSVSSIKNVFQRAAVVSGIGGKLNPHDIRRSAIEAAKRSGGKPDEIQRQARHTDGKTTAIYYRRLSAGELDINVLGGADNE